MVRLSNENYELKKRVRNVDRVECRERERTGLLFSLFLLGNNFGIVQSVRERERGKGKR